MVRRGQQAVYVTYKLKRAKLKTQKFTPSIFVNSDKIIMFALQTEKSQIILKKETIFQVQTNDVKLEDSLFVLNRKIHYDKEIQMVQRLK